MLDNQQKETLTEAINIGIDEGIKQVKVEPEVMQEITEVINNKKKNIWKSLNGYAATAKDMTPVRLRTLNLIAENECIICDEILQEIKSNFTA